MQALFFGSRPHELVRATFREVFSELTKLQQDIFSFCVAQHCFFTKHPVGAKQPVAVS